MAQKEIFQLEPLFADVQLQQIFADGKIFVDCVPKENTAAILEKYLQQKGATGFSLKEFVFAHFGLPKVFAGDFKTTAGSNASQHINKLWAVLTREPDEKKRLSYPIASFIHCSRRKVWRSLLLGQLFHHAWAESSRQG